MKKSLEQMKLEQDKYNQSRKVTLGIGMTALQKQEFLVLAVNSGYKNIQEMVMAMLQEKMAVDNGDIRG